ncbi:PVC-type heme-binding CxxCH protein [Dyadobacter sp. CY323]|uniref:PVC-type heme-binding CxxCH protein n=1 Tax=Dyadobacter sp. CY323 TaxID=2907302 RepID=UPI001F2E0834|nr:PVC-type heme-binding CxxCH protein [Dyadobacter sp. CY323]MCE6990152.1 c-type cytochrome [Dyadobacter sp. CY323]
MKKINLSNCFSWFFQLMILMGILASCQKKEAITGSREGSTPPEKALGTFELEKGFKIELLASEPDVASPVDMEIDEYGRLYVVEMPGYPLDKSGTGRIKLLSDSDGDGKMDKSTVFAEDLVLPNGILRWKKGIMITDAPNVLYLEDTDGDGKADVRDTLLTGFSLSNPHVNVNNPVYGLDNWVYLSHLGAIGTRKYGTEFGDKGSEIRFPGQADGPKLPPNAESHNVRFRPEMHQLEMGSGRSQFGHTFDQWGHHFFTHNQNHIYEEVIGAQYLARNPDLLISDATQVISDHEKATEVFQITKNPDRQLFTPVGVTTSSSGLTAYLGGAFPPPFDGMVTFVAESVSNLVHADIVKEKGATFTASRLQPNKEFLASTDSWSRPVNMYVGPDGALYVLDYYRQTIEHPEWMSDEAVAAGGLYNGYNMGRIYRITPTDAKGSEWTKGLKLGDATNAELVDYLTNANIWWRMNAQRLLVDRADKSVVPVLEKMAANATSPMGRLHALWTLEGMKSLNADLISRSLTDPVPGIRENAIRLAELHRDSSDLLKNLLVLQNDTDPKVRYQLLCTLGYFNTPEAGTARQKLLFKDLDDDWVQIAALSANSSQTAPLLKTVMQTYQSDKPAYAGLLQRLTGIVGAGDKPEPIQELINKAIAPQTGKQSGWQSPILTGLTDGLKRKKIDFALLQNEQNALVESTFENPSADVRKASLQMLKVIGVKDSVQLEKTFKKAIAVAGNRNLPNEKRAEALNFLALGNPAPYAATLAGLIVPQEEPAVQLAALKILGQVPDETAPNYVLKNWERLTPEIRDEALNTFMTNPERVTLLLNAVETGKVKPESVGWPRSVQLMSHSDEKLREKARKLLSGGDKAKTNKEYQQALSLAGDVSKGKLVYMQNCALCHQVRGEIGVGYGPDLGTVHNWLSKDLMANILDPSLSIAPGFDLWEVELKDGSPVQGMIMSETSAAIKLRTAPGIDKMINRQDIKALKVLNMSVMPVLSSQLDHQKMADLIAFLKNSRSE